MSCVTICPNCAMEIDGAQTCTACGSGVDWVNPPEALDANTLLIDKYKVARVLGQGGFGITYLGLDCELKMKVAIKEFLPRQIATRGDDSTVIPKSADEKEYFEDGLNKFMEEAQTVARFHHPNIVPILNYFQQNGTAYYVMRYIPGKTLQQYVVERGGVLDERDVMAIMGPVFDGLETVHQEGILHRDIKPANIYIPDNGSPMLLDFGAARHSLAGSMSISLTHGYAPYEQYQSEGSQGKYSDVYACAATMYACLRGRVVKGKLKPPLSAMDREQGRELDNIKDAARGKISARLAKAVMRGMESRPAKRPRTIAEFRKELGETGPPPPPPAEHYDLLCIAGDFEGQRIPLSGEPVIVGKDHAVCALVLSNKFVSRKHCQFFALEGRAYVKDFGSKNGTFLNDVNRIAPFENVPLNLGDMVSLTGQAVFQVVKGSPRVAPAVEEADPGDAESVRTKGGKESGGASPFVNRVGKYFFSAEGRLNRARFFWTGLGLAVPQWLAMALVMSLPREAQQAGAIGYFSLQIACGVAGVFLTIKRLHDMDRPGTHYWMLLIPFYNIYLGLLLLFKKGVSGPNRFGPDPLAKG